ncbi:hypothetical protein GH714_004250 [Hevea brasiliensis]|uniref:Uncharacterized protein n=1 Tax=Hevea brasiliensis TaxID=3981 RepID=A0A6A6NAL3_HEVBR|nr:hypothetical protein GH714_004250 [Hevea brasiliensis]
MIPDQYLFLLQLFEAHLDSTEVLIRYSSALVQGATNVFWIDIQTNTRHFQALFQEVALEPKRLNKIPVQVQQSLLLCVLKSNIFALNSFGQRDLFLLLSRFLLFYNLDYKLEIFLKRFPVFQMLLVSICFYLHVLMTLEFLKWSASKAEGGTSSIAYLSQIKVLQGMELE